MGHPITWDLEKAEVLSDVFASVLTSTCSSHIIQVAEGKVRNWENKEPPSVGENQVSDHLRNLEVHKSMGPDEIHPPVLRELAEAMAKPLCITLKKL